MSKDLVAREALIRDFLEELKPLNEEHYDDDYRKKFAKLDIDYEQFIKLQESGIVDFVVLLEDERLVGYSLACTLPHLHTRESQLSIIDHLFVSHSSRGNGGASLLLSVMEDVLRDKGSKSISISFRDVQTGSLVVSGMGYFLTECSFSKEL